MILMFQKEVAERILADVNLKIIVELQFYQVEI